MRLAQYGGVTENSAYCVEQARDKWKVGVHLVSDVTMLKAGSKGLAASGDKRKMNYPDNSLDRRFSFLPS
jgi:hypothetical protein